jgi:hypothetical protein
MKTTNQPASHPRRVRTVFALGALAIAVTACGGGDPAPTPEFTRLCASGAETSNGQCAVTATLPDNAPACTRDNRTGLVWEARASLAELSSSAPGSLCGLANWRAPTVYELLTLDHAGNGDAASIDRAFFPDLSDGDPVLASGEDYRGGSGERWTVRFNGRMFVGREQSPQPKPVRWVSGPSLPVAATTVENTLLTNDYRSTNLSAQTPVVVQRGPLMWLILENGSTQTFDQVTSQLSAINQLRQGYTNWRLPTRLELDSLVNRAQSSPATDVGMSPPIGLNSSYWSSSSATVGSVWVVDFNFGDLSELSKSSDARAIYVRR